MCCRSPIAPWRSSCTSRSSSSAPERKSSRRRRNELEEVVLAADELEALRLADVEDLFHTKAAGRMGVSRQTFDRIVRRARMKVARALVRGYALRIIKAVPPVRLDKTS